MTPVKIMPIDRVWLSNKDAQEYLHMSADFFADLRRAGKLRYSKIGKAIFYRKTDIDKMIEQAKVI